MQSRLSLDETRFRALYSEILEIPALRGRNWEVTSPEVIEDVMNILMRNVDQEDPFYPEKSGQNNRILEKYDDFKNYIHKAADPLYTAARLAILGNSIDSMMSSLSSDFEELITEKLEAPLPETAFSTFQRQLENSRFIVYFCDNAGEIVFDRLFIETIKERYHPEIISIVRSNSTLNDATLKEAQSVGLKDITTVAENGIDGPLPGTILRRCSDQVRQWVDQADLIISKGGGNFDTLEEETELLKRKNVTFMLLSKCRPYLAYFGVARYLPILSNFFPSFRQ
jgi:uncharacterized protein with ATP-grasp and redox domains